MKTWHALIGLRQMGVATDMNVAPGQQGADDEAAHGVLGAFVATDVVIKLSPSLYFGGYALAQPLSTGVIVLDA